MKIEIVLTSIFFIMLLCYLHVCFLQIQENVKTLTQDRDNIQLLYEQVSKFRPLLELLFNVREV